MNKDAPLGPPATGFHLAGPSPASEEAFQWSWRAIVGLEGLAV